MTTTPQRSRVRRQPQTGWIPVDWAELWSYRELLFYYAQRDIKVRYRQTLLGITWAVLQPVLTMAVFSVFLGRLAGVPSQGAPYPVFALCGLLPWQLFAYALTQSSHSLVHDAHVVTKVFFPRLILPLASVIAGLVDFGIAFVVLLAVMAVYGIVPGAAVLALPAFAGLAVASALAVGVWLSVINVQFRDVRYVIPFLTQIWFFVTPVAYPASLVPPSWRLLYALNPMVGVVEGFRWALMDLAQPSWAVVAISSGTAGLLLAGGLSYFAHSASRLADVI